MDRARLRLTTTYAVNERLSVGVEYNPLADDVGPLANLRLIDETRLRPALIVGTSSDRIGSTSGRAFYATLSKDLEQLTDWPVAPYVGVTHGRWEERTRPIAGLSVRWGDEWRSTHLFDGVNVHHLLDRSFEGGVTAGVLLIEVGGEYYAGVRLGLRP